MPSAASVSADYDRSLFTGIAGRYARKDSTPSCVHARRYQAMVCVAPLIAHEAPDTKAQRQNGMKAGWQGGNGPCVHALMPSSLSTRPPTSAPRGLGTLVDVGCGIGQNGLYLRNLYSRYIGIDYAESMIEIARSFNADAHATFFAADIRSPDLPAAAGDVILSIGFLHHVDDVGPVLASLTRIARPGAAFVAMEPNRANPLIQLLRWLRARLDGDYSQYQRFFSRRELKDLLEAAGLEKVDVEYQGYCSPPFAQVVLRPQWLFAPLARLAVRCDRAMQKWLPAALRPLSWNLLARATFPTPIEPGAHRGGRHS
jgi:SAM-dependent methyltransferase